MIKHSHAENYTLNLLSRLYGYYDLYTKELLIIQKQLYISPAEVLETFSRIEQHRFQQISSIEKVLSTHINACSYELRESARDQLMILRARALQVSGDTKFLITSQLKNIRTELSSIRIPGRAKNYRQESVPVLIDIET